MASVELCKKLYDEGRLPRCIFFYRPSENAYVNGIFNQSDKGIFSQWYKSKFFDGSHVYTSAEQYMMAKKAELFGDMQTLELILKEDNPAKLKKYGRMVRNFDELVWDTEKYGIVLKGNVMKFFNREMRTALLLTGDAILVEASPYDAVWGIKMGEDDPLISNPYNWNGENLLGRALMDVRDIFSLQNYN